MALKYKFNVLEALKANGYSTYKLRRDKLLSESTVQKLRRSQSVSWDNLSTLCRLLNRQPGDILEYVEDDE